jgi:putative SOS response-associated peptidase YedK
MCGRFSLRARLAELAEHFEVPETELPPFRARYNIAPTQPVLAVRCRPETTPPKRETVLLRWGLIPGWANDPVIGSRLINARAEGLAEKPAFRTAWRRRRCLIAADGFYEWFDPRRNRGEKAKKPAPAKQPYFIRFRDDRPFAFAGLWETWKGPDQPAIESCTIITTSANTLLRPIHDRMPVIIPPEAYARWLDPRLQTHEDLLPLLVPPENDILESYPVGPMVNRATNDLPECVEPLKSIYE